MMLQNEIKTAEGDAVKFLLNEITGNILRLDKVVY